MNLLLLWPLTVLAATGAVLVVRWIAPVLVSLPLALPAFTWGALTVFTIVLVSIAVLVFALVRRRAKDPASTYRRIALVALVVSWIPDLLLHVAKPPLAWYGVLVLMITHVAAWWPTVQLLTKVGVRREI
jgi:hypothetical protein